MLRALELKVPPLALVLIAAGAMWALSASGLTPHLEIPGRTIIAALAVAAGAAVTAAGLIAFRRAQTTVNPMKPDDASALVAGGVYRITRNPMYLGFLLVLLGWAVYLADLGALAIVALFVLYMNRFQIAPEERALERLFGAQFEQYRRRVRRWL